jgi:hypothetical protein
MTTMTTRSTSVLRCRGSSWQPRETDMMIDDSDMMLEYESTCINTPGIESISTDATNVLLSFLNFDDYVSLSLVSKQFNCAISRASHLVMEEPSECASGKVTDYSNSCMADRHRTGGTIRFDQDSLRQLLLRYQSINVLHLSGLAAVGDDLFSILNEAPAASKITSLSLHTISLSYWCPHFLELSNLRELNISGGVIRAALGKLLGAATDGVSSNLEILSIKQCPSLRDEHVRDMVRRLDGTLTSLSLHQCLRVKKPVLRLEKLQHLSLMGCFALSDLPKFSCPALLSLDLSFCFRLSTDRIQRIVESIPALEELTLIKCPSLNTLALRSGTLRVLNVNFCNSLVTLKLTCPRLERLENVGCSSLDTVMLDQANTLQALNLSGHPVTRLELYAVNLSLLNLSGCRLLDRCTIYAPNLHDVKVVGSRMVALRFCKSVRQVIINSWTRTGDLPVIAQ